MSVLLEGDAGSDPFFRGCVVSKPSGIYVYKADVLEVYDADTVTLAVDLGLRVGITREKFRLFGINAPEMRGIERPAGIVSRDWLRNKVLGKSILIQTIPTPKGLDKKGKFGRYLVKLFLPLATDEYIDINAALVTYGYAKEQEY